MAIVRKRKSRGRIGRRVEKRPRPVARKRADGRLASPELRLLHAPTLSKPPPELRREVTVATYNVHRWAGINGRGPTDPARAGFVISELDADVIAVQEAMRPHRADDPLVALADALGMYVIFAATRVHKRGELGNAIFSRWPINGVSMVDLSFSRLERRAAVSAQIPFEGGIFDVVATHLALADRTRHRQVQSLLEHPRFRGGPTLLLGDMNAWRKCKATRALEEEMQHRHHNLDWPASFPSAAPVWSLDRVYARGAKILELFAHESRAAKRASDHLPVVARVELPACGAGRCLRFWVVT